MILSKVQFYPVKLQVHIWWVEKESNLHPLVFQTSAADRVSYLPKSGAGYGTRTRHVGLEDRNITTILILHFSLEVS